MKTIYDSIAQGIGLATILLALTLWSGCVENQITPDFKQTPAKRQKEAISELRTLLKSSEHGWKAAYKPDKQVGYYDFLFKFLQDSIVETHTDFLTADSAMQKSEYNVIWGSTVKLSFTTNSPLHRLADSNISPIPNNSGSGRKGSFEFLYYGKAANGEDLIFRTDRNQDSLVFKKAKAQYPDTLRKYVASLQSFEKTTSAAPFGVLKINHSQGGWNYLQGFLSFNGRTRVVTVQKTGSVKDKVQFVSHYTSSIQPEYAGIRIDSININGKWLKNISLTYQMTANRYESTLADGSTVTLANTKTPPITYDGYKDILAFVKSPQPARFLRYFYNHSGTKGNKKLFSPKFEKIYSEFNDALKSSNLKAEGIMYFIF